MEDLELHISKNQVLRILWPLLAALILVLFPFDWLADVWPAYGQVFDIVFATALAHHIGHATIFFIGALFVLYAFPTLRTRPFLYFLLLLLGAVGEESIQALFKLHLPTLGDGQDVLFDLIGIALAYVIIYLWSWVCSKRSVSTSA
jgi:hypothetical protein